MEYKVQFIPPTPILCSVSARVELMSAISFSSCVPSINTGKVLSRPQDLNCLMLLIFQNSNSKFDGKGYHSINPAYTQFRKQARKQNFKQLLLHPSKPPSKKNTKKPNLLPKVSILHVLKVQSRDSILPEQRQYTKTLLIFSLL